MIIEMVIAHQILNEADLDGDGVLSFAEFQHVISKSSDFMRSASSSSHLEEEVVID